MRDAQSPVTTVRIPMQAVYETRRVIEESDNPALHLNTMYLASMIELAKTTDMRDRFRVDRSTEKARLQTLKRRDAILARHACAFRDVEILRRVASALELELMDVAKWAREMHAKASEKSADKVSKGGSSGCPESNVSGKHQDAAQLGVGSHEAAT